MRKPRRPATKLATEERIANYSTMTTVQYTCLIYCLCSSCEDNSGCLICELVTEIEILLVPVFVFPCLTKLDSVTCIYIILCNVDELLLTRYA